MVSDWQTWVVAERGETEAMRWVPGISVEFKGTLKVNPSCTSFRIRFRLESAVHADDSPYSRSRQDSNGYIRSTYPRILCAYYLILFSRILEHPSYLFTY